MHKRISSTQNAYIKELIQLKEKSRVRKKTGLFLIEGENEINLAIEGEYEFKEILFVPSIFNESKLKIILSKIKNMAVTEVTPEIYSKIALRNSTEGIIAVAKSKKHSLKGLKLSSNPLLLVAEAPEKPGNIGALLRTADAAGVDAVLLANLKTDLYNPNLIRSSVGSVFTVPVITSSTSEIISFLKSCEINMYGTSLVASVAYTKVNFKKPTAIIVGTESVGLSEEWLAQTKQNIIIPMYGKVDSMNVSVSASILIFEAIRQRKKV